MDGIKIVTGSEFVLPSAFPFVRIDYMGVGIHAGIRFSFVRFGREMPLPINVTVERIPPRSTYIYSVVAFSTFRS